MAKTESELAAEQRAAADFSVIGEPPPPPPTIEPELGEGAPPPVATEPTPTPTPEVETEVVSVTSGEDTFIVKQNGIQKTLTTAEIEAAGGVVPEQLQRESVLHQIGVSEGMQARREKEAEFARQDVAAILAGREGISQEAAESTLVRYRQSPNSEEFDTIAAGGSLTLDQKAQLATDAGVSFSRRAEYFKSHTQVGIDVRGDAQYIANKDADALKEADPESWSILFRDGFDALTKKRGKEFAEQTQAFEQRITAREIDIAAQPIRAALAAKFTEYTVAPEPAEFPGEVPVQRFDIDRIIADVNKGTVNRTDVQNYFGKETVEFINEYNAKIKGYIDTNQNKIDSIINIRNIQVADRTNLTANEMEQLIRAGVGAQELVIAGHDIDKVNVAVGAINAEYEAWEGARDKVSAAGFIVREGTQDVARPKTIGELAKWQRDNPGDTTTLGTYFTDEVAKEVNEFNQVTGDIARYYDEGLVPRGRGLAAGIGLTSAERGALGRAFVRLEIKPIEGGYAETWRQSDEDTKTSIAELISKDQYRGSAIASIGADIDVIASKNIGMMLVTAPVAAITHVVAKQMTLPEARAILNDEYSDELEALKDYVKDDGTIDNKRLERDVEYSSTIKKDILEKTGYEDFETLNQNLEYYNNGQKVTGEEWAVAGAVGALDALMLGGAGALLKLGTTGRYIAGGVPIAAAGIFAPASVRTLRSPEATVPEKILAGAIPVMLLTGGVLVIKAPKPSTLSPIGKVKVPVKEAIGVEPPKGVEPPSVVVWRGIKVGNEPLVGVSKGKLTVGKAGIEFPPLEEWNIPKTDTAGNVVFEPRTGLETRVLVNKGALERAGMLEPDAAKFVADIEATLGEVRQFYGKKSPTMNSEWLSKPIDTLDARGVEALMRYVVENNKIVDRVFGSATMRPQLEATNLAQWMETFKRLPGDVDIWLKDASPAQAKAFTDGLVLRLQEAGNTAFVKSAENPTLITGKSLIKNPGVERHAVDIHFKGEPSTEAGSASQFGEMVYGLEKTSPAIKIKLEGIGEISVSRMSETGVGKAEQVMGWRIDPATGKVVLKTASHRTKDYVDLYEIIKEYNGEVAANKWAAETGIVDILKVEARKASGADILTEGANPAITELGELIKSSEPNKARLLKLFEDVETNIREANAEYPAEELTKIGEVATKNIKRIKAIEEGISPNEVASISDDVSKINTELNNVIREWSSRDVGFAWEFSPSKGANASSIGYYSPLVSLTSLPLISASRSIPVGSLSSGRLITAPSRSVVALPSEPPSLPFGVSPIIPPSVSPSVPISGIPSVPPIIEPSEPPSLIPTPEPSEPPRVPPSPEPSEPPSIIPSPEPSPTPTPTPEPSPVPSPEPSPVPPEPEPSIIPGKPPIVGILERDAERDIEEKVPVGSVAWIQGRPEGGPMFKLITPPYRQEDLTTLRDAPAGYVDEGFTGEGSAFKSLQILGGEPSSDIRDIDLGWTRINIKVGGEKPVIEYVHDTEANVGERSRTVGMGKGQIPIEAWEEAKAKGTSFEEFVNTYTGEEVGAQTPDIEATTPVKGFFLEDDVVRSMADEVGIPKNMSLPNVSIIETSEGQPDIMETPQLQEYDKDPKWEITIPAYRLDSVDEEEYELGELAKEDIRHELAHYLEHIEKGTHAGSHKGTADEYAREEIRIELKANKKLAPVNYSDTFHTLRDEYNLSSIDADKLILQIARDLGVSEKDIAIGKEYARIIQDAEDKGVKPGTKGYEPYLDQLKEAEERIEAEFGGANVATSDIADEVIEPSEIASLPGVTGRNNSQALRRQAALDDIFNVEEEEELYGKIKKKRLEGEADEVPWWDKSPFYPTKNGGKSPAVSTGGNTYYGRELLPPDLSSEL